MLTTSSPYLNRGRPAFFGLNVVLVLSMLLTLIVPTPLLQNGRRGSQDMNFIQLSGFPGLGGDILQNCQQRHQCALRFNGVNQWIELHEFRGFDTPAFTLETRFNWAGAGTPIPADNGSLTDGVPFITIGGSEASSSDTNVSLFFGIQASSGRLMAVFESAPSASGLIGQDYSLVGNAQVTPGDWHHAAATYDGQTLSLFLDGNLDAELTLATPILPQLVSARDVYLAAALPSDGKGLGFFKGELDEVRIWEVARSQSEIQATANLDDVADPNLIGHWSMNEGMGTQVNDSSGKGMHGKALNSPIWTDGATMALSTAPLAESTTSTNAAPNPPTLISPADGATGVSTSPTLNVSVSDPDSQNLTVTFYGRVAPQARRPDFTLVALPDTQKYTINGTGIFDTQTQWIVDQQSAQNIVFVSHLGDTVDSWWSDSQWNVASAAMGKLEPPGIPYGIGIGNCDEDHYGVPPDAKYFNTYFPASRFAGRPYYGGAYNGDNSNSYQLFSASGLDFIVIDLKYNLSYYPDQAQAILAWAHNLLQTNSNRRAIVIAHFLLDTSNNFSTDGSQIYSALKDSPNFFLMMGGHQDSEGRRQDPGDDGHAIYSLRSDYQTRANGGNGWLRLLRFSPETNRIYVTTYSPYLGQHETDADSQFSLDYNMNGASFQVIGTTNVPSGSSTAVNWPNLLPGGQYDWYVSVNDGTSTTDGSIWSFTTASESTAPVITTQPANQTVNAGQSASFSVAASGSPTPTVQWQVSTDNGSTWTNIAGATTTTYSFTAQAADNGKQYRAVFTNTAGSATSNAALLTVNNAPVVTIQPANQTVNAGQTATFSAAANGNPTPSVQWQVSNDNGSSWTDIAGATSTTYSFNAQSTDNGKQYHAVFANLAGSATTNAATLTVYSAPTVTMQPANQTVNAGQTATFTAVASGNPNPTVQWQVSSNGTNWSNISGATSSTYSFTAQSTDNGKQYRAVFANVAGSATTNAATLTVNTAPVISTQPGNQTVNAGQTVSFSAAASGSPTPTVQWQVSSDNGTNWSNISGATSSTYSFTAQATDNGKQYHAVFTNVAGAATSSPATLTVNPTAPVITIQPGNQTVNAGQTASFSAAASGNPAPSIQWQVSSDNGSNWSDIGGATSTTYSFTAQATDNGKQYRAVFTNSAGSATTNAAILTVYTAPVITTQPTNQTVNAEQSASFSAVASGSPTPTVQWQVSTDGINWSNISGATSTTYSFNAQSTDNGKQYHAVFTNLAGSATTNAATLTVYSAPTVTMQPANQTVNAGQTATFTAVASGNPTPTVQWQVSTDSGTTWTNIPGATSSTYSFTAQATDNGKQYRAVFTNLAGAATTNAATLTVYSAPTVTTQPANQTVNAGQTATFTAVASGNPNPTVQWQVSPNGTNWSDVNGATATTYSFTAQATDNGKQYRAVFANVAGSATTNAATLTVNTAPVISTQPSNQSVIAGQVASFTAAASGSPTPTVQWQVSADGGSSWTDVPGATSTTYSFTAQSTDNGKQFSAVFTNVAGSAASNAALLTVISDLIFEDDFNSCNAAAWAGGTVNSANLAFNTASGRNSTCGMAVTIANSAAAYTIDPSPNAETRFRMRFYFNPNTLKIAKNGQLTLFNASNTSGQAVIAVQIRYTGSAFQLRVGLLSDGRKWSYTGWSSISRAWHPIEFDWRASTAAGANNGGLTFWLDGAQVASLNAIDNDQQTIDKIALGAVEGMTSTTQGTYFFDDYESHRQSSIGP